MSPSDSPRARRRRDAARQRAEQAHLDALRRAARRRTMIGVGVVIGVIVAAVAVVIVVTNQGTRSATTTTTPPTSAPSTSSTFSSGPPASLPTVAPGEALAGTTPCPEKDGSTPRVTHFSAPPPDCLEPGIDYGATVLTSAGPVAIDLLEKDSARFVNNFVVLARYHYYDGVPFTAVHRGAYAEVGPPAPGAPGYVLPTERHPSLMMLATNLFGLLPQGNDVSGSLLMAMPGDQYTTIPPNTAVLGIILDDRADRSKSLDEQRSVRQVINDLATPSGAPSGVVTITGITIEEQPSTTGPVPAP